jgi:hypothetical protein
MSEELKKESQNYKDIELELQLGDVIQITNPINENLNGQTFIIDYIDKYKTYLINTDSLNRIKINISEDGILGDGNITQIEILSRADTPSFARQNGLITGRWINIFFGGDFPVIITGEITNLEEDMIEIKTVDNDILYINFDYKGIPENLPIDNIEIREKPAKPLAEEEVIKEKPIEEELEVIKEKPIEEEEEQLEVPKLEKEERFVPAEEIQVVVPVKDVKEQMREFIIRADQIKFGDEELGPIVQFIDVSSKEQRYSIDVQVADLLDELLSTIPDTQRTPRVLNNIHIMIERFKQLRDFFSYKDQYGNIDGALVKEASYKPLKLWLQKFHMNLYWILPVVKNIKNVYNVDNIDEDNNDLINLDIDRNLIDMSELIENYRSNNLPVDSNKYTALYSELANYFRPFNYLDPENVNGIIIEKEVRYDINTIVDNLEDLYSSVFSNNMIRNRRFVITKYNLGDTKLDTIESTGTKMNTVRVKITNNDIMSINSILTLPEPAIRFSKINLPATDILTKANLNNIFLNYWELLKKKTNVTTFNIETLENEIDFDENNFANSVKNFVLNLPEEETRGLKKSEIYSKYINIIVPKTRVIFNLMKKYIKGKLSIVDVVSYLEPFLIYTDDLTFKQYQEIVQFIDNKISEYNKSMIEYSRLFKILGNLRSMPVNKLTSFTIIELIDRNLRDDVLNNGYQLENPEETFTNSEILRKLILKDYSKLYTTTIAYENVKLMFPSDISDIFDVEKKHNEDLIKDEEKIDKCDTIVIAKLYTSLEQLENDNNKLIYFDKKYDKTNYGIMEENDEKKGYAKAIINLNIDELRDYIVRDQMKKNKLSESDASYFADTLIDGNKKVIDGQYAILYKGYAANIEDESDYYIRKDDKWVLDTKLSKKYGPIDEPSVICDLQEKCISVTKNNGDNCESIKTNELSLQNSLLTNIIGEFDSKYKISKSEFENEIKNKFDYFMTIIPLISKIETNFLLKYNNEKYKLGVNIDEYSNSKIESPFYELLNIILSQKDFVKKQYDISTFSSKFTRPSIGVNTINGVIESPHWLYCIKTSVPLLPTFKNTLACAYITSPYTYQSQLEIIKSTNGQLSDDGDWWTDKYTGWAICPGDFDIEEGFNEGFKIVSRSIIEEEAGNKIMANPTEKSIKYTTMETIMINNIVNALSIAMGINIEPQKEFIMNSVIETIKSTVESESDYKEKIKTAKKAMPSYRDFFNTSLLYYTLGMFLIALQSSVPSVKTRKTHPGCVRSFSGYPFEGQGDLSSLTYLACITYDIRESGEPWNILKKTNVEKIQNKIKSVIDDLLLQLPEVQRKFIEKTEYLLTNPATEIPEEHNIAKWSAFLPPLVPFKIKHLMNISEQFLNSLLSDLKSGLSHQREKILVIESKILLFSLAIQEKIQEIVKNNRLLLHTANNEPYLENACCDTRDKISTIDYFVNKNPNIYEYNKIVERLSNILDDIKAQTEPILFYSNINTKNFFPTISNNFDEKVIYMAFIFYCKFKSLLPIPDNLITVCTGKPDKNLINIIDPIDIIIEKLKRDGRNYTNEQTLRLIQLISRENIININFDEQIISCVAKLSKLLEAIYDENNPDEIIELSLRDLISKAIDKFEIVTDEYSKEIKDLNNFLILHNEEMTNEVIDFVEKNSGPNITKSSIRKFVNTIQKLNTWEHDKSNRNSDIKISNESMYNIKNFYITFIKNFINIFPNIILNKVNYDNTHIPNYYGFSKIHNSKLVRYISEYFEKLKPFYGIPTLSNILVTIQKIGKNLIKLANDTPCFSSINIGEKILKGVIDERTSKLLFEYYLLRVLISYINLSEEDSMIVTSVAKKTEITDIFSVEYVDEIETRIDLGMSSHTQTDVRILTGNKKELKQKTSELLIAFIEILRNEKETIDTNYENIEDRVFKLREREKDLVTDRLKMMTDEQRDADTMLKITKQGLYSKGLQKGLTMYDKDFYEDEQNLREEMLKAERKIRSKNKDATDENIDILMDEHFEQEQANKDIDDDAFGLDFLNEDFYDGNFDGVEAPEQEYDDYTDFN